MSLWLSERVGQDENEGKTEWRIKASFVQFYLFIKLYFNPISSGHDMEQKLNKLCDESVRCIVSICYVLW